MVKIRYAPPLRHAGKLTDKPGQAAIIWGMGILKRECILELSLAQQPARSVWKQTIIRQN